MDCHPFTSRPFVDEFAASCAHATQVVCDYGVKDAYVSNILYFHVCQAMGWPNEPMVPWKHRPPGKGWAQVVRTAYEKIRDGRKVRGQGMPTEADFRAMVIANMLKGTFG